MANAIIPMRGLSNPIHRLILLTIVLAGCGGKPSENSDTKYSGHTAMRITHAVRDFPAWLKVYKEVSDSASWISVYVSPDDPNLVTVYELTTSHAEARKKFSSEDMRRAMKRAGVSSEPIINFFDIKYRKTSKSNKVFQVL